MKIGIFTDTYTPEINGVVTSIKQLEKELKKHGHEVYIITSSKYRHIVRSGNVIMMPGITLKSLYGYSVSGFYSVFGARYIKKMELDIIHAQTEYGIGIFARIVAFEQGIPLVYTYHTMMEDYTNYITRYTKGYFENQVKKFLIASSKLYADKCTELIVPSNKTKEAMQRYGVKNKINVVPTGIDLADFSSFRFKENELDTLRKEYKIYSDDFLAIFVGRIASEKNVLEIIEAFVSLKRFENHNIKLLIVGDGPQIEECKEMVHNNDLNDLIQFVGKVAHDKVPLYYQIADVFVSTSTTETQGLTFIEAMASHLPVICRHDKNLEDIVIDNYSGFFVSNADELATKLIDLSSKSECSYNELATNAYTIANKYSSNTFYEKIIEVYDNAIRNKRRSKFKARKDRKRKKSI